MTLSMLKKAWYPSSPWPLEMLYQSADVSGKEDQILKAEHVPAHNASACECHYLDLARVPPYPAPRKDSRSDVHSLLLSTYAVDPKGWSHLHTFDKILGGVYRTRKQS